MIGKLVEIKSAKLHLPPLVGRLGSFQHNGVVVNVGGRNILARYEEIKSIRRVNQKQAVESVGATEPRDSRLGNI